MIRTYRPLPDIPNGYPLDDVWSVVVPIARTNLVTNPSFETNTTSWTAIGGSIARSTTYQYHGAYSLAITPTATVTDGARFDTVSLTSGTTYAYSAKVRGVGGLKYKIAIETTGAVELASVTFTASGRWQWIFGYYTETSTTTRRFTARKTTGNASIGIFYLDGAQVEAIASGELVSTYLDGDQLGLVPNQNPVAYYWNGTPHASSSARSGLTRAGGMVMPFRKYGFILIAIVGLGLALPANVATEYARLDGGYDDYTRKPTRQFTLTGRFQGRTYRQLRDLRGDLADLLDRDLIAQDQRLTLLRYVEDMRGVQVTDTARVFAKYQGGLGGNTDNQHAEATPITFTQYLPNVMSDGEAGAALSVQLSIGSNAQTILQRSTTGVWSAMGSGGSGGAATSIVEGLDGLVYVGGEFTQIVGIANTNGIAVWNPLTQAWAALGTGAAGGLVYQLALMPDGGIVAVGTFTSMGGVANTNRIAKWNGAAWVSIATGFVGTDIKAALVAPTGILYIAGNFSSVGGTAAAFVSSYTGSAWVALGAGIAAIGNALAWGSGFLYAAADSTNVSRWNGTAWTNIGTTTGGASASAFALAVDTALNLYAAGDFTVIGGVTVANIAKWNGVSWTPLGSGLTGGTASALFFDQAKLLNVGGSFTTAGGIVVPGRSAKWTGSTWVFLDIIPAASGPVRAGMLARSGIFYLGWNNAAGTATAAGTTTITNPGTARTYPKIVINGPSSATSRIYSIQNPTTNRTIYLNLTLSVGETATLVLQPDNLSFMSTFQGNVMSSVLPGSTIADFFLQPGANTIAFLSASSTVVATMNWRPAFVSLDDIN